MITFQKFQSLIREFSQKKVTFVAVSKTRSIEKILTLYNYGQRDFGENYVQELIPKYKSLPKDIRWHMIGHLQTNKVKHIAPFIAQVQSVDSSRLLAEIDKQAHKFRRTIDCLLEIKIADQITKTGIAISEIPEIIQFGNTCKSIRIKGFMGIATNTTNSQIISQEFSYLKNQFDKYQQKNPLLTILFMGMSHDYELAIRIGSNMVRLGTLLFGTRN